MGKGLFIIDAVNFSDADTAKKALDGAPILVMPLGVRHRWGDRFEVTEAMVKEFAENFKNRESVGIRRSKVAVDVDHEGGAVGWYQDVFPGDAGLMATMSWTSKGRKTLEAGEYAYFSPTVYWRQEDSVTGETIYNQIAGGALTNYPFFGEATALYSERNSKQNDGGNESMDEKDTHANDEIIKRSLKEVLTDLFSAKPDGAPSGVSRDEFSQLSGKLDELSAANESLTKERDTFKAKAEAEATRIEAMSARIAEVELARSNEHFSVMAREEFSHLPAETSAIADAMRWLNEANAEKAKFFTELLKKADAKYADAYNANGGRGANVGSAETELKRKADEFKAQNPGKSDTEAFSAVMADPDNAALYESYRAEVHHG